MSTVRPERWLHLAWYAEPGKYQSPENFRWVQASLNLLHAGEAGKSALSWQVLAPNTTGNTGCREAMTLRPTTLWNDTCVAVDVVVWRRFCWHQRGVGAGIFPHGPGESAATCAHRHRSPLAGRRLIARRASRSKDFLYVEDVVGAFVTS
jgi:hypothetical protein